MGYIVNITRKLYIKIDVEIEVLILYYLPRLKETRKNKNLTQKEVCNMLQMKQSQYSRYESGEDEMKIGTLIEICNVLEVSADYILGLSDSPTQNWTIKNNININGNNNGKITMK